MKTVLLLSISFIIRPSMADLIRAKNSKITKAQPAVSEFVRQMADSAVKGVEARHQQKNYFAELAQRHEEELKKYQAALKKRQQDELKRRHQAQLDKLHKAELDKRRLAELSRRHQAELDKRHRAELNKWNRAEPEERFRAKVSERLNERFLAEAKGGAERKRDSKRGHLVKKYAQVQSQTNNCNIIGNGKVQWCYNWG